MKTIILMTCLLIGTPAWATPLTFDFTGHNGTYATVTGSFTYDSAASPTGYNVRGRDPNVTYALTDWEMTVTNSFSTLPAFYNLANFPSTITFSNTLANNTSEFCVGECIFSSQLFEGLVFSNGLQTLQLEFLINNLDPFVGAPPGTLADWGQMSASTDTLGGASWLKLYEANGQLKMLALLTDGSITGVTVGAAAPVQSVPEVPTGVLCLIGFAMVGWVLHTRRVA